MIARIVEKYGISLILRRGEESWEVRALLQPVRSKSWDTSDSNYSPLGEIPRGRYIYLGPLEPVAVAGDTMEMQERQFLVRRSEVIYGPKGPAYCWALCVEKGGADHWGRQS